jgi:hypothetical protein
MLRPKRPAGWGWEAIFTPGREYFGWTPSKNKCKLGSPVIFTSAGVSDNFCLQFSLFCRMAPFPQGKLTHLHKSSLFSPSMGPVACFDSAACSEEPFLHPYVRATFLGLLNPEIPKITHTHRHTTYTLMNQHMWTQTHCAHTDMLTHTYTGFTCTHIMYIHTFEHTQHAPIYTHIQRLSTCTHPHRHTICIAFTHPHKHTHSCAHINEYSHTCTHPIFTCMWTHTYAHTLQHTRSHTHSPGSCS